MFPPVISNVTHVPNPPDPYEIVTVSAKVTEPADASGVKNVTLWYTAAASWASTGMTLHGGLWTANIPGLSKGVYVKYFVEAFDNAGNNAKTSTLDYMVTIPNIPPVAEFSKSASTVYTSEVIDFDASGSYDIDGYIVSYSWDFGDGNTDSGVTVSHSYVDDGEYSVTLSVVDDDGAVGSKTASIIVKNRPPVADLNTSTAILDKEEIVTFNASGSYDPDGYIVDYSWDFGDGNTATGVTASHSYPTSGTYTVTLTVTDDGATDSITATKTVRNRPPVASFTETAEIVDTEETISFDASESSDPDGTIVSYSWDFGDGTKGTGVSVQHAYSQDGSYIVTLTVTDNDGAKDTAEATKMVHNRSPIASFTESAETVSSGESIDFDGSESHDPDGTIVSYSWDFGDGNTATGVEVDHAYEDDGVYTVTLTVIDDDDATGSATATKNVLNRPPIASFTENATIVSKDEAIHFDASESHDPDGTIVNYLWDFGDGNTATGVTSDHAYSEDGNYTVTLTVTDDDGASALLVAAKIVETETETEIETTLSLAVLSVIGLGVTALTATLIYGLFIRRKKKKKTEENT
ncbi:MAG: PKD domain-containing protein [Candidatus Bathyarchaeota archaeon]